MEGVFAPKTPISTANRSKPRALFGIILTCLNRELVFLLPKVKKREYFEFAWAHLAPKVIDSNGSHIGEGRIAYALHSVQTVWNRKKTFYQKLDLLDESTNIFYYKRYSRKKPVNIYLVPNKFSGTL